MGDGGDGFNVAGGIKEGVRKECCHANRTYIGFAWVTCMLRSLFVWDEQGLGCESNHVRTIDEPLRACAKVCVCGPVMWPPPPKKKESGPTQKPNEKNDRVN